MCSALVQGSNLIYKPLARLWCVILVMMKGLVACLPSSDDGLQENGDQFRHEIGTSICLDGSLLVNGFPFGTK